jgi:hypothetical protein
MQPPGHLLADDPRRLVAEARDLARLVRRQQRATWLPRLAFAALTFAALTFACLAAVLVPVTFGGLQQPVQPDRPWCTLPAAFLGTVLLLGGIGFALAQRPVRPAAS